jgi:hypothetical protein
MSTKIIHKLGLTLIILLSLSIPTLAERQIWLDQSNPQNWNKPGANLPKTKSDIEENCKNMIRVPRNATERLVTQAGWQIFKDTKSNGKTTLIRGISSADIRCRLAESQIFVFHNGIFAGTASPKTITYHIDGAFRDWKLLTEKTFIVKFDRYKDTDCSACPSGSTIVNFKIDMINNRPVVIPIKTQTKPFSDSSL